MGQIVEAPRPVLSGWTAVSAGVRPVDTVTVTPAPSPPAVRTPRWLFTKWSFNDLIQQWVVQVIQPDVSHDGGISETKKIAAMAEAKFMEVGLHNASSEVLTAASLTVDACTPNCTIQDHSMRSPWRYEVVRTAWAIQRGYADLCTAPGLDVEPPVASSPSLEASSSVSTSLRARAPVNVPNFR